MYATATTIPHSFSSTCICAHCFPTLIHDILLWQRYWCCLWISTPQISHPRVGHSCVCFCKTALRGRCAVGYCMCVCLLLFLLPLLGVDLHLVLLGNHMWRTCSLYSKTFLCALSRCLVYIANESNFTAHPSGHTQHHNYLQIPSTKSDHHQVISSSVVPHPLFHPCFTPHSLLPASLFSPILPEGYPI